MHHIIYLSTATVPFSQEQLHELLALSRYNNEQLEITGVLFHGNEHFLQVLEGEEAAVRLVYTQIRSDKRHGSIITFADKPVAQRAFAGWAMGYQLVSAARFTHLVGYVGSPAAPVDTTGFSEQDLRLFELLRSFVLP